MAKCRGARSEIVVVRSRANRRDTRFGVLPRSSLSILLTLPTLTGSKIVAESEGKCAERSEGNLAEGEPEGREAVARGRGSNVKPSRGTSESTCLGIAAPRNTTNAGFARLAPRMRGNVPMEGATPAGGGKPSVAVFRQARLVEKRRARFRAASPPASLPTSREIR